MLALRLTTGPPEDEVHDGLVHALPRGGEVPEGLSGEGHAVLLHTVPAQGGVRGPALEGCVEELGVADGGPCEGGAARGPVGWGVEVRQVDVHVFRAGWGWPGRCRMACRRGAGCSGVL